MARIRRAKLFLFLRRRRHELFDEAFQAELASLYRDSAKGQPPVPPAQLALATILQAYTGVSDDEVIEVLTMDRRWQLVLDCLDTEEAPFGKATLIRFRQNLISTGLDRRLIERTVALAERDGTVGPRQVRAALDASPLWGAGRVEDTINLLGHAVGRALGMLAREQGREPRAVFAEAGAGLLAGSSLKAALDLDWTEPTARQQAVTIVLAMLDAVTAWLAAEPEVPAEIGTALGVAAIVRAQDVDQTEAGPTLREGVAKDRRISIEDGAMRHGRKSKRQRVDGFKRHVLRDLDTDLIRAVGVTPANAPEASAIEVVLADLAPQGVHLAELHIDRGYLSSSVVRDRPADLTVFCKAWPVRNGDHFPKTAFTLDWEAGTIRCPNAVTIPFAVGETVRFPAEHCAACPLRARCTTSARGRSVSIHPDERLLVEFRERQHTPAGRAKLRERVAVEHSLAHVGRWQGRRARYRGERKNLFDTRRAAVVHNLHVLMRQEAA